MVLGTYQTEITFNIELAFNHTVVHLAKYRECSVNKQRMLQTNHKSALKLHFRDIPAP